MKNDDKWNKKRITFGIFQEDILLSYRYLILIALNRIEKIHNANSSAIQQELIDGNAQTSLGLLEDYIHTIKNSCDQLEEVCDLIKNELEIETTEETKGEKK